MIKKHTLIEFICDKKNNTHCNCSWKMCDLVLNDLHRVQLVQGDNQRDWALLKNHLNLLDFCFFHEFHVSALKAAKQCFQRTLCVCVRIACVCGCVCNIPESVRGMRITSDRGRM